MKVIIVLLLLFIHPLTWGNNMSMHELGRSIANYQACSKVSIAINDDLMFDYYQSMFNDTSVGLLALKSDQSTLIYAIWDVSEKVLLNIGEQNLRQVCLSRFDELSRKMLKKVVTK